MKTKLLALALFCALLAIAILHRLSPANISDKTIAPDLIRAKTDPIKHRPADPGGMAIPFQELELWRLLGDKPVGATEDGSR